MKRQMLLCALSIALLVGCRQSTKVDFDTYNLQQEQYFYCGLNADGDSVFALVEYNIDWPVDGAITAEASKELMYCCFGDSSRATAAEAIALWQSVHGKGTPVPKNKYQPSAYHSIWSECHINGNIATFDIYDEENATSMDHGNYLYRCLNIDLQTRQVIHLQDIVDLSQLATLLPQAIRQLDTNWVAAYCIFDEFRDSMPVPTDFFFDATRTHLVVSYNYIAPYDCAAPLSVVLPIDWLSERIALTSYANTILAINSND